MINFPHLSQRLFNVPLAITPMKAELVMAVLADCLGVSHIFRRSSGTIVAMDDFDVAYGTPGLSVGYQVVRGVAIIPVCGTLVQKLGYMQPLSGMTGYDGIRANLSMALQDPEVRAIVLDIDSPGGEVAGCFDLVDDIRAARGEKTIWAILSECAYSAAYAIASAADYITVPRTGGTGSIGVICMHVDFSKALEGAGIAVTLIHYGDRKADGHPEKPLSAGALEAFQNDVDTMGELFVNIVAKNRGLTAKDVRDMQAATYLGADGVQVGLADAVMSPAQALTALLDTLN